MSKPTPPKYKTTNWKAYNAALKARGSLMIWLDRDMNWQGSPLGKRGRTQTFSDAAIQFCLTIKCLFNLALRQAVGMVQSLLSLAGLDWSTPDYSTVCRRQKHLQVMIPCRPTTAGLHLLIDSTGIKMLGEGEWKTKKHGAEYRRQWRKVHLGIDAQTLEIRAIEVTDNSVGDAPMLPELLSQIPPEERIATVSGDGAYDTKDCHEAIAKRQAEAVIPTRRNAMPWKENRVGAHVRNEILRATRRLGRTIWKKWSGYHRRSLVETKMRCVKLLGERVMARDFDRQVAELQVRAAILNRFTCLGTPTTVRMP
ncbi:IS5 family transposase [Paludibacterium yongneupense]|uniref:IS5 family transposase n=1 Tax=Paludibacterium yongneupense TaxID=400061 RepID=UPI0004102939|nr:IS5 family transposase [Paludibacterium yongneupense]